MTRLVLAAVVVVAGCQPPPRHVTAMPANAPKQMLPACATSLVWGSAWTRYDCRTDEVIDVDGDGVSDCLRMVATDRAIELWAWPRCAGEPIATTVERARDGRDQTVLSLAFPEALRSQAWVRAIAELLVGRDHVSCERATPGCATPDPALAWISDASRPLLPSSWRETRAYDPHWLDGEPQLPPIEALVLDPDRARRDTYNPRWIQLAKMQLVVLDPRQETLTPYGTCARYETYAGDTLAAAVDRATHRWSWIQIGEEPRVFDAGCDGETVFVAHGTGTDTQMLYTIEPATGVFADVNPNNFDWRAILAGTIAMSPTITLDQLAALIEPPVATRPCDTPLLPLIDLDGAHLCAARGQQSDGRCWTATPLGNAHAGILSWDVEAAACSDGTNSTSGRIEPVHVIGVMPNTGLPARWLAELAVGAARVRCIPTTSSCPGPGAALRRLLDVAIARGDGSTRALRWADGTPAMPTPEAVVISGVQPGLQYDAAQRAILFNPQPPAIDARPLALAARCGELELWSAPSAAAVVDVAKHRWAWLWIASEHFVGDRDGGADFGEDDVPHAIRTARCEGEVAVLELSSHELVRVDIRTGAAALDPSRR